LVTDPEQITEYLKPRSSHICHYANTLTGIPYFHTLAMPLALNVQFSRQRQQIFSCSLRPITAGFKGGGQTGQLPRASAIKGPAQKAVKKYYLRKHKNIFWSVDSIGTCIHYSLLDLGCLIIHLIHYKMYISILS